jgi:hypothetical protein
MTASDVRGDFRQLLRGAPAPLLPDLSGAAERIATGTKLARDAVSRRLDRLLLNPRLLGAAGPSRCGRNAPGGVC